MAAVTTKIRLQGAKELADLLREVAPNEARNLLRATVHGVAGEVRDRIKQRAPRRTGRLAKAIRAERRKADNDNMPVSDVVVEHGKGSTYDAFYWHFQEFGTVKQAAHPFIVPTIEEMRGRMPEIMRNEFGQKYEKLLARKKKAGA